MPSINGLTNPFENAIESLNFNQIEKQKRLDNYAKAVSMGYEPPAEILQSIENLLASGDLSAAGQDALNEMLDEILGEIAPVITSNDGNATAIINFEENSVASVTTVMAIDRYSLNDGSDTLTYSISEGDDAGFFSINAVTGVLTFLAPPDFEARPDAYNITVVVSDGAILTDTQSLSIFVTNVNEAPVISAIALTNVDETTDSSAITANIAVAFTDVDLAEVGHTAAVTNTGASGNLAGLTLDAAALAALVSLGAVTKAAGSNAGAIDMTFAAAATVFDYLKLGESVTLTYALAVSDAGGLSDSTAFTVVIHGANDAPAAAAGMVSGNEDTVISGVVSATDVDGDTLTYSVLTDAANGSVLLQSDGSFTYTPNDDFYGPDSFVYQVSDGAGGLDTATVSIEVAAVNDDPVAQAGLIIIGDEDTVLTGIVSATDVDGDALNFSVFQGAANGTVDMNADGSFSYTPDEDYFGADEFIFEVEDGMGGSATESVAFNVNPVADGFTVNTAATPIAINYVRGLTYDAAHAGGYQNFGGVAFDSVSGKVYESAGIHRYNENYVRVYDDAANFEAGTYSQTISLGNQIDINYPSDIVGTYFAAHDDQLIGRSSLYGSDFSATSARAWDVGFWNATNGAMNTELTVNPGADFTGFNYGGYNAMNVMNDGDDVYALSRYSNSGTWQLAELDSATNSVIGTENINLGTVGFAFVVEDFLFIGSTYSSGVVSRAYDIENDVMHNVNLQFGVPGNIYWSNTSYDSETDSLYLVSSPNTSALGEIYEVENVSDFLFA